MLIKFSFSPAPLRILHTISKSENKNTTKPISQKTLKTKSQLKIQTFWKSNSPNYKLKLNIKFSLNRNKSLFYLCTFWLNSDKNWKIRFQFKFLITSYIDPKTDTQCMIQPVFHLVNVCASILILLLMKCDFLSDKIAKLIALSDSPDYKLFCIWRLSNKIQF